MTNIIVPDGYYEQFLIEQIELREEKRINYECR